MERIEAPAVDLEAYPEKKLGILNFLRNETRCSRNH